MYIFMHVASRQSCWPSAILPWLLASQAGSDSNTEVTQKAFAIPFCPSSMADPDKVKPWLICAVWPPAAQVSSVSAAGVGARKTQQDVILLGCAVLLVQVRMVKALLQHMPEVDQLISQPGMGTCLRWPSTFWSCAPCLAGLSDSGS